MSVQSHTPSTCSRPSPSRALHGEHLHSRPCRDKPTPVSRLLTGARKQSPQEGSFQAKEPALGHPGEKVGMLPQGGSSQMAYVSRLWGQEWTSRI